MAHLRWHTSNHLKTHIIVQLCMQFFSDRTSDKHEFTACWSPTKVIVDTGSSLCGFPCKECSLNNH